MQRLNVCKGLAELLKKEGEALKEAYAHRYYLELIKEGVNVTYKQAVTHFEQNFLNSWAEGYKECYCQNVCQYRNICNLGDENLHHYRKLMELE